MAQLAQNGVQLALRRIAFRLTSDQLLENLLGPIVFLGRHQGITEMRESIGQVE